MGDMYHLSTVRKSGRFFFLQANNSKHKLPHTPLQEIECMGVVFEDTGHVVLDTTQIQASYRDMAEMQKILGRWGKCEIIYIKGDRKDL